MKKHYLHTHILFSQIFAFSFCYTKQFYYCFDSDYARSGQVKSIVNIIFTSKVAKLPRVMQSTVKTVLLNCLIQFMFNA